MYDVGCSGFWKKQLCLGFGVRLCRRSPGLESLECFGQLGGQRDMRERRLLTHELAAAGVPEEGIKN